MRGWLVEILGEPYATLVLWALALIAVALILWIVLSLIRRVTPGTFVSGGRRQQRLAVTDAAQVDNNRRLILVRRDNVEHLVLIGGPSDVVVERNIPVPGTGAEPRVVEPPAERPKTPRPQPVPRPADPQPRPEPSIQIAEAARPAAQAERTPEPPPSHEPAPRTAAPASPAAAATPQPRTAEPAVGRREPELAPGQSAESLEDEMSRFLNELSDERK